MRRLSIPAFTSRITNPAKPLSIDFELTDSCPLACRHCYWRGMKRAKKPISRTLAKSILEQARDSGALWVTFTGGDPLLHPDFPEIYLRARRLGLIPTIFTSGTAFTPKLFALLRKAPPYCVEITLNGSNAKTQEAITGTPGSFSKTISSVKHLKKCGIPVVLKANLMKLNAGDITDIKKLAHRLLGEGGRYLHPFQYDPHIQIALSGDKAPAGLRLDFGAFLEAISADGEMKKEILESLSAPAPRLGRPTKYKYRCAGGNSFTVTPDGFLQYCSFERKYRKNLRKVPFAEAARDISCAISRATLPASCKCRDCRMRASCGWCPAKARLETGKEGPVPFLCRYTSDLLSHCASPSGRRKK